MCGKFEYYKTPKPTENDTYMRNGESGCEAVRVKQEIKVDLSGTCENC